MAQYNGYVDVPHASYQEWRDATLGNGYNVDNTYGNQCWDFCALLWYQYGLTLYTGSSHYASECWTQNKDNNAVPPFEAVNGVENIKRGDVVVFNGSTNYPTGHIAFADQDYADRVNNRLDFLGQNQGDNTSSDPSCIASVGLNNFLGIFRNTNWTTPPTPTEEPKKKKFPWPVAWQHWNNFKR